MGITKLKEKIILIHQNTFFEIFFVGVIIFSGLTLGLRTYDIDPIYLHFMAIIDWGITLLFLIEISIRYIVENNIKRFFSQGWNIFDTLVVVVSLVPIEDSEIVWLARLIRIFRILRIISFVPELRILVTALIRSLPPMGYIVLLMFILFYIYAALGSYWFESINPVLWGDIAVSMLTLFRVVTFEDWTDVMYETMTRFPYSWIYFLTFIFFNAFVFLNMMIGVVLERMQSEQEQFKLAQGKGEEAEILHIHQDTRLILEKLEAIEKRMAALEHKG